MKGYNLRGAKMAKTPKIISKRGPYAAIAIAIDKLKGKISVNPTGSKSTSLVVTCDYY